MRLSNTLFDIRQHGDTTKMFCHKKTAHGLATLGGMNDLEEMCYSTQKP
jgi:hypothetical protein